MKVDKAEFDALLHQLMQTHPEPKSEIKTSGKIGKIIPAIPQSKPAKA